MLSATHLTNELDVTMIISLTDNNSDSGSNSSIANSSMTNQLLVIANILIGLIGLVGNTFFFVIIVCFTSMHKQLAHIFIVNQSIIDALSASLVIAQMVSELTLHPILTQNEFASEVYCRVWQTQLFVWSMYTSSKYNLVVLTIERYLKIVHPILHKTSFSLRKAKVLLIFVWLFGIVSEVIYLVPTSRVVGSYCWTEAFWPDVITHQIVGYLIIVVQYWLPLLIFIVAYAKMIKIFRLARVHANGQGK